MASQYCVNSVRIDQREKVELERVLGRARRGFLQRCSDLEDVEGLPRVGGQELRDPIGQRSRSLAELCERHWHGNSVSSPW
jgi:hypothetical protein